MKNLTGAPVVIARSGALAALIPWLRPAERWPEKQLLTPEQAAELKEARHG